jgi:hypothetical protein
VNTLSGCAGVFDSMPNSRNAACMLL